MLLTSRILEKACQGIVSPPVIMFQFVSSGRSMFSMCRVFMSILKLWREIKITPAKKAPISTYHTHRQQGFARRTTPKNADTQKSGFRVITLSVVVLNAAYSWFDLLHSCRKEMRTRREQTCTCHLGETENRGVSVSAKVPTCSAVSGYVTASDCESGRTSVTWNEMQIGSGSGSGTWTPTSGFWTSRQERRLRLACQGRDKAQVCVSDTHMGGRDSCVKWTHRLGC